LKINRTVQRSVDILSYIAAHPDGASIDELCEHFSLPRTSAYDILTTLVQCQMLSVKPGIRQSYQTGLQAYRIGMSYPDANDELKLIGNFLKELAEKADHTAFFGKHSDHEVLYILKEVPKNPIITTATVGSTAPLYCTALGKTILAFLPPEQSETLLEHLDFRPRTKRTILSPGKLKKELKCIRQRGYALDFREYEDHMVCAAAPVYNRDGLLLGAVSLSGFYRPDEDYTQTGHFIKKSAAELSKLLGFNGF